MQEGKVSLAYSTFLGYDKGDDGKLKVNKEQAETIKLIFKLYLLGYSAYHIKERLESMHIKSPAGKDRWHIGTICSILDNEKYIGDALLQKGYTVDFLTKKRKKNEDEIPQFYVKDDHEAIIDKNAFEMVKIEKEKRRHIPHFSGISIYSNKIVCGECGAFFGRKVWHSTDKNKQVVYRCNEKYNGHKCDSGHITEDEIKEKFIEAYNKMYKHRKDLIEDAEMIKTKLAIKSKEKKERDKLEKEIQDIYKKSEILIQENSIKKQDQNKYKEEYNKLVKESEELNEKLAKIDEKLKEKSMRVNVLDDYINTLKSCKTALTNFDEGLFAALLDKMIINKDKVQVVWRDGSTVEALK